MTPDALDELILRAIDDTIDDDGTRTLNELLRSDAAARSRYLALADQHAVLAVDEQVWSDRSPVTLRRSLPREWWRTLPSAAAGLVIGLFASSATWAIASPDMVATVTRLVWLVDGSFENTLGPIPSGFPTAPGYWSGDKAEIVRASSLSSAEAAHEGKQLLRFVSAQAETNHAGAAARSCDFFQVVDLRLLRAQGSIGELSLNVAAQVRDARTTEGEPLWFTCRLYLFSASAEPLHAAWPEALNEARGVAIASLTSRGGPGHQDWKPLSARCLLPEQADLAVVMVSCGYQPGDRRSLPTLGQQFVDGVTLSLHQQPTLPTRTVAEITP